MIILLLLNMFLPAKQIVNASIEEGMKAAFIRNHDLWVKIGEKEHQVTSGENVQYPKWSYNGKWLAFQKREDQKSEIWLYQLETRQLFNVIQTEFPTYRWSPNENKLAILVGDKLKMIETDKLTLGEKKNQIYKKVFEGVGNFSWLPKGKEFLISTAPVQVPEGWADIQLLIVPEDISQDMNKVKQLFTLPSQTEKYFAITTSLFKWSPDGRWISFLGIPTASLAADVNTLFILSADGKKLIQVDEMLNNENWFHWAPDLKYLAYIEGVGRNATQNKQLKIKKFNKWGMKEASLTPEGYVDWDFTWRSDRIITISRAQESDLQLDSAERPLPFLVQIDIKKNRQTVLTSPPENFGDFYPVYLRKSSQLSWVRFNHQKAEAWIASPDGSEAVRWIENIDPAPEYYERWDWPAVISYYN